MKRYHYFGTIFTILSLIFVLSYEQEPDEPDVRVILEWNELAIKTAAEVDRFQTLRSNRAVPMVHLAMHDALNAIVPVYSNMLTPDPVKKLTLLLPLLRPHMM